ncbi:hypothetical protein EIP86_000288 [Pleurotus ostreatoroseus]|nr:hypothetical protein EIP86_000288 [Pleurotus ostreatoroseus]
MTTTNLEEAANVASEFISKLLAEIQKESGKYVRHSLRAAPGQPLAAKDAATPAAVQAQYAEIDRLAREKEAHAERIVQLVARARTKLDCDLSRVLVLQGEPEPATQPGYYYGSTARNPVAQLNESLRSAVSIAELPAAPATAVQAAPPQKRRRTGLSSSVPSAGSIKLPSPAPVAAAVSAAGASSSAAQRSRLSQQVHPRASPAARGRRATASVGPDADEDAEGEEDLDEDGGEDGGDAEDTQIYCFCQKMSYGEVRAQLTVCRAWCAALFVSMCALCADAMRLRLQLAGQSAFLLLLLPSSSGGDIDRPQCRELNPWAALARALAALWKPYPEGTARGGFLGGTVYHGLGKLRGHIARARSRQTLRFLTEDVGRCVRWRV